MTQGKRREPPSLRQAEIAFAHLLNTYPAKTFTVRWRPDLEDIPWIVTIGELRLGRGYTLAQAVEQAERAVG